MLWSYSKIDESKVKIIEELESKLNVTLLAFSGQDIKNVELTPENLKLIEEAEEKLGLSLLAVKA
ncbi:MAG: hypothetical protein RBT65_15030 [Methanolobus sp.]|nr:hypothetical protein [Methanolobus sp.]